MIVDDASRILFEGAKSNQLLNLLNCTQGIYAVAVHNVFHQFHIFCFLRRLVKIHFNNFIHRLKDGVMALVISRFLLLIFPALHFLIIASLSHCCALFL